jgi:hypothetical protein
VLCQVGQDEPTLAAWPEVGGQSGQEAVKHGAVRVVDALLRGAGRPGGEPGRVAHDEVGAACGEQAGAGDLDKVGQCEAVGVVFGAGQGAWADVGGLRG